MSYQKDSETQIKALTTVCQNVCSFIKTVTVENASKDEKINDFKTKIDDLQCFASDLETQLENIFNNVKTLANLLNFTIKQGETTIDILARWILSLTTKNVECTKKRKLYSPLKLSLKDKVEINKNTEDNSKSIKFRQENHKCNLTLKNKSSSQDEVQNVWKLNIKRDGNPSDLLKKSKQTTLLFRPQEEKVKLDITTFNTPTSKVSSVNSSFIFTPEVLNSKKKNVNHNISINDTKLNISLDNTVFDSNTSVSHLNKIIKPNENRSISPILLEENIMILNKSNTSNSDSPTHDNESDETIYSPVNIPMTTVKDTLPSKKICKNINEILLDSYDIIPGLNDKQNDLPSYNFKENPVRKRNERKLLNGWDCENCCKFYEANNDNSFEAKSAMNKFSRHRSVKQQNIAQTPPGFWNPT